MERPKDAKRDDLSRMGRRMSDDAEEQVDKALRSAIEGHSKGGSSKLDSIKSKYR
jgi:hypothetical protein